MITHTQESEAVFATVSTVALSGPLLRKGGKLSVPAHCCVAAEAQVTRPSPNIFILNVCHVLLRTYEYARTAEFRVKSV